MFDLKPYLEKQRRDIDQALESVLQHAAEPGRLRDAMRHSLMAGGKRLRPVLCLAAARAVGGRGDEAMEAACALEMVHTYSLIHDDLPAMDDDDLRRGKPTCHVAFDEATAILAGDALLTLAFEVLMRAGCAHPPRAADWLRAGQVIARAAGCRGMVEGQMRDMTAEERHLQLDELRQMHALKTGALITAAVESGAILGGGSAEQVDALARYARRIGLAFQVTDDILNVEGDPALMGKAVGTDEARQKSTYPALMGLEQSRDYASRLVGEALDSLASFGPGAAPLAAVARYILERRR
jgi:geranylgeranyl diphosphate synthase type II